MIIRGGENIYPREIENFLYQLAQIEMVEVAGITDKTYGEIVGAFIKLKKGQSHTQEEVQPFCRGKISRIKIPGHVIFVDNFPKTASGKIQKYNLRQMGVEYVQGLNYYVVYFPIQKFLKILPSNSSVVISPVISPRK